MNRKACQLVRIRNLCRRKSCCGLQGNWPRSKLTNDQITEIQTYPSQMEQVDYHW